MSNCMNTGFARWVLATFLAWAAFAIGPAAAQDRTSVRDRNGADTEDADRAPADAAVRPAEVRAADLGLWFRRQSPDGLVIADVAPSGAVAQYGFREGDRIVSVDGLPVQTEADFIETLLAEEVVRQRVPVVLLRNGRRQILYVRPEVFVTQLQSVSVDPLERLGIELDDRYTRRIVVWRVVPRSPAYYAGIRAGDIITSFDGERVSDAGKFVRLIDLAEPILLEIQVIRGQQTKDLEVDLSIADHIRQQRIVAVRPMRMDWTYDDIRAVDPHSDRRLSPRPDVPPGMRVPGGEVGRERGPISPAGAAMGTPTTPPYTGSSR